MPNKTTQILKEFRKNFVPVIMGDVTIRLPSKYHDKRTYTALQEFITEALSQQQQEDYQEVLDLELMQKEELVRDGTGNEVVTVVRNNFRDELYKAIAEKRGKV